MSPLFSTNITKNDFNDVFYDKSEHTPRFIQHHRKDSHNKNKWK